MLNYHWFSDMVAFPNLEIEPTLMNDTGLTPTDNNRNNNVSLVNEANGRVRDQVFTVSRVTMSPDKNNYALKFNNIDKSDDKKQNVDINPEPVFVKKVAGKKSHEINARDYACFNLRYI